MNDQLQVPLDMLVMHEMELLLEEKRTALSALLTGIAIFAFPLGVLSVLIATSRSYQLHEVMHWLVPLPLLNVGQVALAVCLVLRAFRRVNHSDRLIDRLKRKHNRLAELLA
jgi:hypothetical protein